MNFGDRLIPKIKPSMKIRPFLGEKPQDVCCVYYSDYNYDPYCQNRPSRYSYLHLLIYILFILQISDWLYEKTVIFENNIYKTYS